MKARLHSKRYLKQILLLTVTIFLVLCTIFILILYVNAFNTSTNSIARAEHDRTATLLFQSEIYLEQPIALCNSLIGLDIPSNELTVSRNFWARTIFNALLSSHSNINTYIENIDLKFDGESYFPTKIAHENHVGKFYFFDIYTNETISWPYYFDLDFIHKNKKSSITLTLSAFHLSDLVFTHDSSERLDYLLTENGTVLLTNQKSSFFANITDLYPEIDLLPNGSSADKICSYDKYYYTLSATNKYDFQVLSLVPKTAYSHQYTTILLQTLLMSCILLLISLVMSFFLATRFYHPINSMIELLRTYIQDDLHDYENEIAYIYQNISKYVTKGKEAESLLPQTLEQLHNAQTAVLQHQVNSHFLFNTLENIKMLSVMELGVDNEIENSIILLNHIIHEGILLKKSIVPLSHELYLAKCYLELMQMRFPLVKIDWSVDESLLQCSVFKFSLQPVLENCFAHAFKGDIGREKLLSISICRKENNLLFRIKDNGHGMDADSLKKIEQLLASETEPDTPQHVGIRNVHKRITNVFGADYGIHLYSTPPGTTVDILYPVTPMK